MLFITIREAKLHFFKLVDAANRGEMIINPTCALSFAPYQ